MVLLVLDPLRTLEPGPPRVLRRSKTNKTIYLCMFFLIFHWKNQKYNLNMCDFSILWWKNQKYNLFMYDFEFKNQESYIFKWYFWFFQWKIKKTCINKWFYWFWTLSGLLSPDRWALECRDSTESVSLISFDKETINSGPWSLDIEPWPCC